MGLATHFFEIFSLKSRQNADISIFLKKEGKDISSQISLEFAFSSLLACTIFFSSGIK